MLVVITHIKQKNISNSVTLSPGLRVSFATAIYQLSISQCMNRRCGYVRGSAPSKGLLVGAPSNKLSQAFTFTLLVTNQTYFPSALKLLVKRAKDITLDFERLS